MRFPEAPETVQVHTFKDRPDSENGGLTVNRQKIPLEDLDKVLGGGSSN